ncbi:MAG TPA: hypothetical protein VN866_01350, partial [Mycobacterium sp.]|nr:hypothetical protein [Mycobacterium sp.]
GGDRLDGLTRVRKDRSDQVRFDGAIPVEVQLRQPLGDAAIASLRDQIETAVRENLRVRVSVQCHPAGTVPVEMYKNALTYVG